MANDLNQCQFIGRLGKDPEQESMPNGNAVTKLSLAVGEKYKDKNTGQNVENTEWIRVVAFGRLAEIMGQYLTKGSKIYLSGKMKTRMWEKDNQKHYSTEIIANSMQMLDSKPAQQDYRGHTGSNQANPTYQQPQQQAPGGFDDFDDDIPF